VFDRRGPPLRGAHERSISSSRQPLYTRNADDFRFLEGLVAVVAI
jgi:hypothetical protein